MKILLIDEEDVAPPIRVILLIISMRHFPPEIANHNHITMITKFCETALLCARTGCPLHATASAQVGLFILHGSR